MDGSQQGETRDAPAELLELFRFALLSRAFGISEAKVTADFRNGLEDLRQRGVLSLEDMARARAKTAEDAKEHPAQWAAGFEAGYCSAWAAATLRVLDVRDVAVPTWVYRALSVWPNAKGLTRFLGRAVTVTDAEDLFTLDPAQPSSHGS